MHHGRCWVTQVAQDLVTHLCSKDTQDHPMDGGLGIYNNIRENDWKENSSEWGIMLRVSELKQNPEGEDRENRRVQVVTTPSPKDLGYLLVF